MNPIEGQHQERPDAKDLPPVNDGRDLGTFGDKIDSNKSNNSIRVMFQNVMGFGYTPKQLKTECTKELVLQSRADIFCMAEVNTSWKLTSQKNTIKTIARHWFEKSTTSTAQNIHYHSKKRHQPGGVSIISQGHLALRSIQQKHDERKMGRWTSQLFRGKGDIRTRVVSVYVPHVAKEHGSKKIFCQQQEALLNNKVSGAVLTVFWKDFWEQIDFWLDSGEQLVIAGDWNKDVRMDWIQPFTERQLIPAITHRHPDDYQPTCNKGSKPIDEIFHSSSIKIKAAGYLEFGHGKSDHRPIWVDFDHQTFLGSNLPPIPSFDARKLKMIDPRVVEKYNQLLEERLHKHGVFHRAHRLLLQFQVPLTKEQQEEFEKLDRIRVAAMKYAEKNCRKLRTGAVKWSPELQQARDKIKYVALSISKKLKRKVGARVLIRLSEKTSLNTTNMSLEDMKAKLKVLYIEYKAIKKKAAEKRTEYLTSLAEAYEERNMGKKANIIKQLIEREQLRDMYRKLKYINKKANNLSTSYVTVKNENGEKVDITDRKEMEQAITEENRQKYHQIENTCPFINEPLREQFGDYGIGPETDNVLQGTYVAPDTLDESTICFLEQCKIPLGKNTITKLERSIEDFKSSWEKMNERTGTRDLHFGHFKAATKNSLNLLLHYALAEIPFRSGYTPERWKQASDLMILKKEGVNDVDRLRTIVLFEADFNHNNKFLGRAMMYHTVLNDMLAKEQYSTPGKKCIDHVINRRLLFDLIRYQKSTLSMAAVDLKSCYDRVSHSAAFLAMTGFGIPKEPVESMLNTLQNIEHRTKTVHGISEAKFGGKEDGFKAAPQTLGQGNGAGPSVWAVVSSRMFQVLHKKGLASSLHCPISKDTLQLCGFAFVDDSDIIAVSNSKVNPTDTLTKMQSVLDQWEQVAKTTGGAIEPKKCWSYLVHFEWDKSAWKYGSNTDKKLYALDADNKKQEINVISSSQAEKMLGVFLAPDGNDQRQIDYLMDKSIHLGECIRAGHVQKHEAWISLQTMAMKSIEYPLPALNLSEEQLKTIMWPILRNFLPKSGINRYVKRDILYGTPELQGFGLKNPYLLQGIKHVSDMVENLWKESITGHLLRANLEQLRLEIGTNDPIFRTDITKFDNVLLTESWTRSSWEFCTKHNIQIDIDSPTIPLLRENDTCIMQSFMDNPIIQYYELKTLNKCRIYLQAFSLADITTGDGLRITKKAWEGIKASPMRDIEGWPLWGNPSVAEWKTWRKALTSTFSDHIANRYLRKSLGNWSSKPKARWYVDRRDDSLWEIIEDKCYRRAKMNRSKRQPRYQGELPESTATPNKEFLLPTTIFQEYGMIFQEGVTDVVTTPNNKATNFSYKQWLLRNVEYKGNIQYLIQCLQQGKVQAVSDGSFKEGRGTASWWIETEDKTSSISGTSIAPGHSHDQSAYRSEVLGLLAILETLRILSSDFAIKEGQCIIACDGISALKKIMYTPASAISAKLLHSDLLSAAIKIRDNLPLTLIPTHVKGHQDDNIPFHLLPRIAQLNILTDLKAKIELEECEANKLTTSNFPGHNFSFPSITHNGQQLFHQINEQLYNSIANERSIITWIKRERITSQTVEMVNWKAQGKAWKNSSIGHRRFIGKWVSNVTPTGEKLQEWKMRLDGQCPFCFKPKENRDHILRCNNKDSIAIWNKAITEFDEFMEKADTLPGLRKAIINELNYWRNKQQPNISSYINLVQPAIKQQRAIGWGRFLEGLMATKITALQKHYYSISKSRKSPKLWTSKVIKQSWSVIYKKWKGRNAQLHDPPTINKLEGIDILHRAITKEYALGLNSLPLSEFTHLFKKPLEKILKSSLEMKQSWFATVRAGRIVYKDTIIQDGFAEKGPLQKWVGLNPTLFPSKRERKYIQQLDTAIKKEYNIGLANLPISSYSQFFRQSLQYLLDSPLQRRKDWFTTVRGGRMIHKVNLFKDPFRQRGRLQQWVGLNYSLYSA